MMKQIAAYVEAGAMSQITEVDYEKSFVFFIIYLCVFYYASWLQ